MNTSSIYDTDAAFVALSEGLEKIKKARTEDTAFRHFKDVARKLFQKVGAPVDDAYTAPMRSVAAEKGIAAAKIERELTRQLNEQQARRRTAAKKVEGTGGNSYITEEQQQWLEVLHSHTETDEEGKQRPIPYALVVQQCRPGLAYFLNPGAPKTKENHHAWMEWTVEFEETATDVVKNGSWKRLDPTDVRLFIGWLTEMSGVTSVSSKKKFINDTYEILKDECRPKKLDEYGNEVYMGYKDLDQPNDLIQDARGNAISLKTCLPVPHRKDSPMIKRLAAVYTPDAECPAWVKFMEDCSGVTQARNEKEKKIAQTRLLYMQRTMGAALLPHNDDHIFHYDFGKQQTGKSTRLDVFAAVVGDDHCVRLSSKEIVRRKGDPAGDPNKTIAQMAGYRVAIFSDMGSGGYLRGEVVKPMTGEDRAASKKLYQDPTNEDITATPFLQGNVKTAPGADVEGLERRGRLNDPKIRADGIIKNVRLRKELKMLEERNGILNWLLAGLQQYNAIGESVPAFIEQETARYLQDHSLPVRRFKTNMLHADEEARTPLIDVFNCFNDWVESEGLLTEEDRRHQLLSRDQFRRFLDDAHVAVERRDCNGQYFVVGHRIREDVHLAQNARRDSETAKVIADYATATEDNDF